MKDVNIRAAIDLIFSIFGERLIGYRIKLFAIANVTLGVIAYANESFLPFLCNTFNVVCNLEGQKWFSGYVAITGIIMYVARKFTNTPEGDFNTMLRRFKPGYKEEIQKLRR